MPESARPRSHALRRKIALWFERRYEKSKDPASREVTTARGEGFAEFADRKHCLVVSYRRDGTAVPTPVWFGSDSRGLYFRSRAGSAKVKRIRRNPQILVAPCDENGAPLGEAVAAAAEPLADREKAEAEKSIRANQGFDRRFYMRFFSTPPDDEAYFRVVPASAKKENG